MEAGNVEYWVICRALLEPGEVASLAARFPQLRVGGSTESPPNERRRHHIQVEASTRQQALSLVTEALNSIGADSSDLEVVLPESE